MIILKCVKESGKLRIKFHCFINGQNQQYTNVYNNSYNCKFPKDIRRAGAYYKVNDGDIRLSMLKKPTILFNKNKKHCRHDGFGNSYSIESNRRGFINHANI